MLCHLCLEIFGAQGAFCLLLGLSLRCHAATLATGTLRIYTGPLPSLVSEDKVRVPLFLNREHAKGPVWPQDGSPSCGNMELHFPVDGIPGS